MAQTNLTLCIDEDVKKEVDVLLDDIGLNISTAVNVFFRQIIRERAIPFKLSANIPNDETLAAIEEIQALKNSPDKRVYRNFAELLHEVNADV